MVLLLPLKFSSASNTLNNKIAAPIYPFTDKISARKAYANIAENTGSSDKINPV